MKAQFFRAAGARAITKRIAIAGTLMLASTLLSAQDVPDDDQRASGAAAEVARPSNAEIMNNPVLRNALSRSTEGLVYQRGPDGSVSVDLQGRFQNVSVARIDADGEIRMGCATSHKSLAEFLTAHPGASEDDYVDGDVDEQFLAELAAEAREHGDDR